ncbi:hypothetical protein M8J75_012745 [Diaphorina citri]|nr:hypothetical protein M8J75_012745 [Diaphorina citri]
MPTDSDNLSMFLYKRRSQVRFPDPTDRESPRNPEAAQPSGPLKSSGKIWDSFLESRESNKRIQYER